jgi:hypothetical protein
VVAAALAGWPMAGRAHEIPADVTVHALVRPAGSRAQVVVRVPMAAMRDVNFPVTPAGFLDLGGLDPLLREAATLWVAGSLSIYENDVRLPAPQVVAARVSLPADRSLGSWDTAVAHVRGPPLPPDTTLVWNQSLVDVLLEAPIASESSAFSIRPEFARLGLRVVTVLRFVLPDGTVRAFEFTGDPGLVRLDPSWFQAARSFVRLGFGHILGGIDHLLFLLCLVVPFRRLRELILIVTAFTVAHSITMVASALGLAPGQLWFPPLIETLIAMSILYMALENIVIGSSGGRAGAPALTRRWTITFLFGLVHGFGFSFALRESLQFAGSHLVASLVAFNAGVEAGQVFALLVLVPALGLLFGRVVSERLGTIVISALVAHTAWHWTIERGQLLAEFDLTADLSGWLLLVRALIVGLAVAAAWWAIDVLRSRTGGANRAATPGSADAGLDPPLDRPRV